MTEILDRPPDEPEGDDQAAKTDDDTEIVTRVDFLDTDDLDEDEIGETDDA